MWILRRPASRMFKKFVIVVLDIIVYNKESI